MTGRKRQRIEDLLKHVHACQRRGRTAGTESVAGFLRVSSNKAVKLIAEAEVLGLIHSTARGLELTESGRDLALAVVRAHRLWERYLADEAGMSLSRVHADADRREHQRSGDLLDRLDATLGHPKTDPHGDPIPTAAGRLPVAPGKPLTDWPVGRPGRIAHLEDEPASVFDQIVALGMLPGQTVELLGVDDAQQLRLLVDGRECVVPPVVAANIYLDPMGRDDREALSEARRLTSLRQGQGGVILGFDDAMRGFHRRRLLDLGLTPGTPIVAERTAMFSDPTAYRVRGTLIALRREQADRILIEGNN